MKVKSITKSQLDLLTREDLLTVIARMHDTIQDWSNGWGLTSEEAETLTIVGKAAAKGLKGTGKSFKESQFHSIIPVHQKLPNLIVVNSTAAPADDGYVSDTH